MKKFEIILHFLM